MALIKQRVFLLLAALLILALAAWHQRPDGRLRVMVLPTPGDAILIRTPGGRHVLIDGGRDPALLTLLLGRHLPYWQRDLHAVVLTRGDGQRLPGQVAALARYGVQLVLAPPDLGRGGAAAEWRRLTAMSGARTLTLRAGQRFNLDGVMLLVLGAEPGEQGGAVLLLHYGRTRVLLHTGGPLGDEAARHAGAAYGPVTLLVYPWQRPLDTEAVAVAKPRAIVFSQAYEAAAPALLTYADRRRYSPQVYHPKNDGIVTLASDGHRVRITTDPVWAS